MGWDETDMNCYGMGLDGTKKIRSMDQPGYHIVLFFK